MRHGYGHNFLVIPGGDRTENLERTTTSADDFWPEVSSNWAREDRACLAGVHSAGRVVLEVLLVLTVAGLMVGAVAIWMPILS